MADSAQSVDCRSFLAVSSRLTLSGALQTGTCRYGPRTLPAEHRQYSCSVQDLCTPDLRRCDYGSVVAISDHASDFTSWYRTKLYYGT